MRTRGRAVVRRARVTVDWPGELARQCVTFGLPAPVAEFAFAKAIGRRWRFDLSWPDLRLALEVDGGAFAGGRHTRGAGFRADCEKTTEAAIAGWRIIRVLPEQVRSGVALGYVERAIGAARTS